MLAEINRRRASAQSCGSRGSFPAAGALSWNDQLFAAAAGHAKDMVARSFFSHTGSSGSSVADRVSAAGYAWSTVAENIVRHRDENGPFRRRRVVVLVVREGNPKNINDWDDLLKPGISVVTQLPSTSFKELMSPIMRARILPVGRLSKKEKSRVWM